MGFPLFEPPCTILRPWTTLLTMQAIVLPEARARQKLCGNCGIHSAVHSGQSVFLRVQRKFLLPTAARSFSESRLRDSPAGFFVRCLIRCLITALAVERPVWPTQCGWHVGLLLPAPV